MTFPLTSEELDTMRPADTGPNGYPENWETPLSVAMERLAVERERLAVERERLAVEREHLAVMKSIRDMIRGRDGDGNPLKSVLSALVMVVTAVVKVPPASSAPSPPPSPPPANGKRVASASEIDSQYGNPKVRFDPKRWKGPSFKGQTYSACDPAFLEEYADALDYFAGEAQKKVDAGTADDNAKKGAKYDPIDAARARGWAARIRSTGYTPPPTPPADAGPLI